MNRDRSALPYANRFALVNRRAALAAAGTVLATAVGVASRMASIAPARAQGQAMATPNPLGPAVPPEIVRFASDWPTAQGDLAAHRAAAGSRIASSTID